MDLFCLNGIGPAHIKREKQDVNKYQQVAVRKLSGNYFTSAI